MARNVQVLLVENVDNTGIVGDVVNVRKGFARNYLLPRGLATTPDEAKVAELQVKRKDAIKALGTLRTAREALIAKLAGQQLTMVRSCNDLGILYGAVTQHEIAVELAKAGFPGVVDREVRIALPIKRIGDYAVTIKFSQIQIPDDDSAKASAKPSKKADAVQPDLEAEVKVLVKPDRELDLNRTRDEAEAAVDASIIEKRAKDKSATFATEKPKSKEAPAEPKPSSKMGWGTKPAADTGDTTPKADKAPKAEKADKKADKKK